jgi:hypothetical protein
LSFCDSSAFTFFNTHFQRRPHFCCFCPHRTFSILSDTSHSLTHISRSILDMQYSFVKACLLALAATTSVTAQIAGFDVITAPTPEEVIEAGSTYTIKWEPSDPAGPITLRLLEGTSNITLGFAPGFIARKISKSPTSAA